jgi:hypothetical protein
LEIDIRQELEGLDMAVWNLELIKILGLIGASVGCAFHGAKVLGIDFEQEMASLDMAGKLERIKSLAAV